MENPEGKITRMRIPDDDMPGWIALFTEMGIGKAEMDLILSRLNQTYAERSSNEVISELHNHLCSTVEERIGRPLSDKEKGDIKQKILKNLPDFIDKARTFPDSPESE